MLLRYSAASEVTGLPLDPVVAGVGWICFSSKKSNNNRDIPDLLHKQILSVPNVLSYWNNLSPELEENLVLTF